MRNILLAVNTENPPLDVAVADTFFTRLRGLMLRRSLPRGQGLLIAPCNSIHMCFMRFAIDAVYIDRDYRVLKVVHNLRPWLGLSWCRGAWGVIELTAGGAEKYGLRTGIVLQAVE